MSEVRIYLGKRGSGKSTLLHDDLRLFPRVMLYDTLGESLYNDFQRVGSIRELCRCLERNPDFVRIAYRGLRPGQRLRMASDFDRFLRCALACRNFAVGVEEVELFCNPHSVPIPLEHIVSIGRHRDLSFLCTSRRPPAVHPLIRSQANEIISFVQTEPRDIQWCAEVMGEEAQRLAQLGPHEFIRWTDAAHTHSEITQDDDED